MSNTTVPGVSLFSFVILFCMYQSRHSKNSRLDIDEPTPRSRPRTAPIRQLTRSRVKRRDAFQPKVVKSNHDIEAWDTVFGRGSGLQPLRDTGIALQSRRDIRLAQRKKNFNLVLIVTLAIFFATLFAGIIWMQHSDAKGRELAAHSSESKASNTKSTLVTQTSQTSAHANGLDGVASIAATSTQPSVAKTLTLEAQEESVTAQCPTPQIATYKKVKIFLPVSVKNLTEVGFHQASYSYGLAMKTHMPSYSLAKAKKQKGTKRDKSIQPMGKDVLLCGSALKYWRSGRNTPITSAADCGAPASSLVYSPVTGIVTDVCTYNYDDKVNDYEIHIRPEGTSGIEMVLIHVKSPYVVEGDKVVGGVTPIARVRNMSAYVRNQLATYTKGKGNHTHIQMNDITNDEYKRRHSE